MKVEAEIAEQAKGATNTSPAEYSRLIAIEIAGAQLALQYMQLAGCEPPTPAPNIHRAEQQSYDCAYKNVGTKLVNPKASADCPEMRNQMNDIKAGRP